MKSFNKLTLPADFAQRILDNQIQFKLSDKPSSQVICNLIELYSQGVEYYESIKSYKYLYFKKKMTQLFTDNSRIFDVKKEESSREQVESPIKKKLNSKNDFERMQALNVKEKQQKLQREINDQTQSHATKKEVQKLLSHANEKEKSLENHIKSSVENQDKLLQQKLRQRKKKSFCKSFSAYGLTESTQTKQSLFNEDLLPKLINDKLNDKTKVEPLFVNFENVIKDEDSGQDEKEMIIKQVKSIIPKGRMASMGRLVE